MPSSNSNNKETKKMSCPKCGAEHLPNTATSEHCWPVAYAMITSTSINKEMKTNTTLQKKLERLSKTFNTAIRQATLTDFRAWAYGEQLQRVVYGDYIFELVVRPKDPAWKGIQHVYILERGSSGSAQVVGVCEQPSEELLAEMKGQK